MSTIQANAILDASGGNTATVNGITPLSNSARFARNLIINGDLSVWQRATSSSSTGVNSADRWYHAEGTFSQETSIVPTNFQYAIKCVTNASNTPLLVQKMERPQVCGHIVGQDITVSFYARSSNVNAITKLELNDEGGSGGRPDGGAQTLSAADTWERITYTFTAPFSSLTGSSVAVVLTFANSATVYITGFQVEVGSVATDYEHRTYADELQACQRYFAKLGADPNSTGNTSYQAYAAGCNQSNNTSQNIALIYPQTMRVTPTLAYSGNIGITANGSYVNVSSFAGAYGGTKSVLLQTNSPAVGSAGQGVVLLSNADTTAYITLTAEL